MPAPHLDWIKNWQTVWTNDVVRGFQACHSANHQKLRGDDYQPNHRKKQTHCAPFYVQGSAHSFFFEPNQREHVRTRALEPSTEKPRQSEACESQRNKGGNFFSKPHVGLTLSSETIHFLWELLLSTEWQEDRDNGGSESVAFNISAAIYHHQIWVWLKYKEVWLNNRTLSAPHHKSFIPGSELLGTLLDCLIVRKSVMSWK